MRICPLGHVALLLFVSQLALAAPARNDGTVLRGFVSGVMSAVGEPELPGRVAALKRALVDNPEILTVIGRGRPATELINEAGFAEFAGDFGGGRVAELIADQILQKTNPRASKGLREELIAEFVTQEIDGKGDASEAWFNKKLVDYGQKFEAMTPEQRYTRLGDLPDSWFGWASEGLLDAAGKAQFSKSRAMQDMIRELGSDPDPRSKLFSEMLMPYFDRMAAVDKAKIISGFLELPPDAPAMDKGRVFVQNAKIGLQKMLQLQGRKTNDPDVRKIMKELLANVKPPVEPGSVLFEREYGKPANEFFSYFDDKPVKAGTTGPVYRAILHSGEQVYLKIRRPGAKAEVMREFDVFAKIIDGLPKPTDGSPDLAPAAIKLLFSFRDSIVNNELDYRYEARRIGDANRLAKRATWWKFWEPKIGIVELHSAMPASEGVLIMKKLPGRPAGDYAGPEYAAKRGKLLMNILKIMHKEALFGSGFFHGDGHPENWFIDGIDTWRPKAYLLDLGNSDFLQLAEQRALILAGMWVKARKPERVIEALEKMRPEDSSLTPGEIDNFRATALQVINQVFAAPESVIPESQKLGKIIGELVAQGLPISERIGNFSRGVDFLVDQIKEANEQLPKHKEKRKQWEEDASGAREVEVEVDVPYFDYDRMLERASMWKVIAGATISRKQAKLTPEELKEFQAAEKELKATRGARSAAPEPARLHRPAHPAVR